MILYFLPYLICHVKWKKVSAYSVTISGRSRASGQKLQEGLFQLIKGSPSKQELYHKAACSSTELPASGKMSNQELGTTCQGWCKKGLCIKEKAADIKDKDSWQFLNTGSMPCTLLVLFVCSYFYLPNNSVVDTIFMPILQLALLSWLST